MGERRRRSLRWLLAAALAASSAAAQSSPAVEMLHHAHGSAARARAATAVGRIHSADARAALEGALDDRAGAVRAAAATALATLGDAAAVPALTAHAHDHSSSAREAIAAALRTLAARTVPGSAPASAWTVTPVAAPAPPAAPVDWRHVRALIRVGALADHSGGDASHITQLREAVRAAVAEDPRFVLDPGPLPASVTANLRRGRVHSYSLEGAITALREANPGGVASVRAEVSLVLLHEPVHSIAATLSGAATAQATNARAPGAPDPLPRLRLRAIEGAAHGALRSLQNQLLERRAAR